MRGVVRAILNWPLLSVAIVVSAQAQDAGELYRQGVDRQRQGDLAGAVEAYRNSLQQDSSNVAARSNLGAALVGLGRYEEAALCYAGSVREGVSMSALLPLLAALTASAPLTVADLPSPDVQWVSPTLVCRIRYTELDDQGRFLHPRYMGLRKDKKAKEIRLND